MPRNPASEKIDGLLLRFIKERNGAVVENMERAGIRYARSYGVSTATIREVAARYAPDDGMARILYRRPVRELQLAALFIADPETLTLEDLPFWAEGVINSEVAEYLAFALLGRSKIVWEVFTLWWPMEERPLLRYCALMTVARSLVLNGDTARWHAGQISEAVDEALKSDDSLLRSAGERLRERGY